MPLVRVAAGRRFASASALCLVLVLAGCSVNRPNPSWQVPTAPTLGSKDTVYYVTDRTPAKLTAKCRPGETLTTQPMYGNADSAAGGLLYGAFGVQLPPLTAYGALVSYHPRPECLRSASDAVFLTGPTPQERAQFFAALREAALKSPGRQLLVFVHGYDFEFDEAILWAAELNRFLESGGPVVVYDWASRGDLLAYREDEQAVGRSVPRLEGFLRELHEQMGEVRIDLIAHSIGTRLLLNALQPIAQRHAGSPLFRNLILAAPDVATGQFIDQVARSLSLAQRSTLYVSSRDRALFASQRLHKDFRAGRDLILIQGVDTVDVSPVDTSRTRHSYYIENRWVLNDIYQLLYCEASPARRFGLVEVRAGDASFWQLRP